MGGIMRFVSLSAAILFLGVVASTRVTVGQDIWPYSYETKFKDEQADRKVIIRAKSIQWIREKKQNGRTTRSCIAPANVHERAVVIFRHDTPRKIRCADITVTLLQQTGGAFRILISTDGVEYHPLDAFEARGRAKERTEVYDITPLISDRTTVWVKIEMVADKAPTQEFVRVSGYRLRADFEAWTWFEGTRRFIWTKHPAATLRCVKNRPLIDGNPTEKVWANSAVLQPFLVNSLKLATWQTEARMCYDPENLYIAIRAHCNPTPPPNARSLKPGELHFWRDRIVLAINNDLDPWSY